MRYLVPPVLDEPQFVRERLVSVQARLERIPVPLHGGREVVDIYGRFEVAATLTQDLGELVLLGYRKGLADRLLRFHSSLLLQLTYDERTHRIAIDVDSLLYGGRGLPCLVSQSSIHQPPLDPV